MLLSGVSTSEVMEGRSTTMKISLLQCEVLFKKLCFCLTMSFNYLLTFKDLKQYVPFPRIFAPQLM